MFCPKCGKQLEENAKFCNSCGQKLIREENTTVKHQQKPNPEKRRKKKGLTAMGATVGGLLVASTVVLVMVGISIGKRAASKEFTNADKQETIYELKEETTEEAQNIVGYPMERPRLIHTLARERMQEMKPQVAGYKTKTDLEHLTNWKQYFFDEKSEALAMLQENLFLVEKGYDAEFYETYETNRYAMIPNFVTVDSMMHTYHLYFSYLMKETEKNSLKDLLHSVSLEMLEQSMHQYEEVKGTEWEEAALRNVTFFAVGMLLQEQNVNIPEQAVVMATQELEKIREAEAIAECALTGEALDYTQFKPRGYYAGDAELEQYFRAMMWYGQIGFLHKSEELERSGVLMTLAMKEGAIKQWEELYTVTSFFAGTSDDLTYYEFLPAMEAAYGKEVALQNLVDNAEGWKALRELTSKMVPPAINSIPVYDDNNSDTKATMINKGFRFMGQRFTMDAMIFQNLIYDNVQENRKGEKRMLPDTLDVAAALGSDTAYSILEKQGDTEYAGYKENMERLKKGIAEGQESLWSSSLYSQWLYTLKPLLEKKGDGYPDFMRGEQWAKKNLESFSGSYTELKHDTVLYAKQAMAEMGGGELPKWDDRGYVEPEVDVWARFANLATQTAKGLEEFGMLKQADQENLNRLAQMAEQFLAMSEKELSNQLLTEEEYELIRNYGGNLEHFWLETLKDKGTQIQKGDFPAAIVTDIATDPNGTCLQVGTGNPSTLLVVVPMDGELHICKGAVYSFYQFEQPISQRLTDQEWREKMGISMNSDGNYQYDDASIQQPDWTQSYRYEYK